MRLLKRVVPLHCSQTLNLNLRFISISFRELIDQPTDPCGFKGILNYTYYNRVLCIRYTAAYILKKISRNVLIYYYIHISYLCL